jgi:hypothetical protein
MEEGTDAFWQIRKKIMMSKIGCRLFGNALEWSSGRGGDVPSAGGGRKPLPP